MRRLLTLSLLAALPGTGAAQGTTTFSPDTVVAAPGRPRIVMLGNPTAGLTALRLSVPLAEHPLEAGAGAALARLAAERMEGAARQVGARVSAERTPWGIAYHVAGAEIDVEYLTFLLRLAAAEPRPTAAALAAVRDELSATLERRAESPYERLVRDLRTRVAPEVSPIEGTTGSVPGLQPGMLHDVWSRSHRPERMTVVVESSLEPTPLLAMLDDVGARAPAPPPLDDALVPEETAVPSPPALRAWYAEAWVDPSALDPHAAVLAEMLRARLAGGPAELEMAVQLTQLPDRAVFTLVGAAYPSHAAEVRRRVSGAVTGIRDALDESALGRAVARVLLTHRTSARTPSGLVEVIGRALDATGEPSGATRYAASLERVSPASMRAYLARLIGPATAEIRP